MAREDCNAGPVGNAISLPRCRARSRRFGCLLTGEKNKTLMPSPVNKSTGFASGSTAVSCTGTLPCYAYHTTITGQDSEMT